MAKRKGTTNNRARQRRIANCETCKGEPVEKEFHTGKFKGKCCNTCLEVISFEDLE